MSAARTEATRAANGRAEIIDGIDKEGEKRRLGEEGLYTFAANVGSVYRQGFGFLYRCLLF